MPDRGGRKSGARLERLVIGGEPYVLKHLDLAQDWTMRASGCLRRRAAGGLGAGPAGPAARLLQPADRRGRAGAAGRAPAPRAAARC